MHLSQMFTRFWEIISKSPILTFYTILIFTNNLCYGMTNSIPGIVLTDLEFIYDAPIKVLSYISALSMLGYMIGSLVGLAYHFLNRQIVLIIAVSLMCVTFFFIPIYGNAYLLLGATLVFGIGAGAWDSSTALWLVEMWPRYKGTVFQLANSMYGIGSIVSPLLISPFAFGNVTASANQTVDFYFAQSITNFNHNNYTNNYTDPFVDLNPSIGRRKASLMIPFTISAMMQAIAPITMLALMFCHPYRVKIDRRCSTFTITECNIDISKVRFRKLKVAIMAVVYAFYKMVEVCYFFFSPTLFQLLPIRMTIGQSSKAYSLMTIGYTTGKLLTGILLLKLTSNIIIVFHFSLILLTTITLYLFQSSPASIYSQSVLIGYGFSSMTPALLQYTEERLKLTFKISTLFSMTLGFASAVSPMMLGIYFDSNPELIFAFTAVAIVLCLTLYIILEVMTCFDARQ